MRVSIPRILALLVGAIFLMTTGGLTAMPCNPDVAPDVSPSHDSVTHGTVSDGEDCGGSDSGPSAHSCLPDMAYMAAPDVPRPDQGAWSLDGYGTAVGVGGGNARPSPTATPPPAASARPGDPLWLLTGRLRL